MGDRIKFICYVWLLDSSECPSGTLFYHCSMRKTSRQTNFCSLWCSRRRKTFAKDFQHWRGLLWVFHLTYTISCKFTLRHFVEKFYVTTVYIFPMACQELFSSTVKLLTEKILKWESFSPSSTHTLDLIKLLWHSPGEVSLWKGV